MRRQRAELAWAVVGCLVTPAAAQEPPFEFVGIKKVVQLTVIESAPVDVPDHIKTIAVANRYLPEAGGGKKIAKVIEGWNSGEQYGQDRLGAEAGVAGLVEALQHSERFSVVQSGEQLEGTGMEFFPEPLSAETVQRICEAHDADALIALEAFDSAADWKYGEPPRAGSDAEPRGRIRVTAGWRLYDGKSGFIVDESHDRETGYTDDDQKDAVQDMAREAAAAYVRRIAPSWIVVDRLFYGKGSPALKEAAKLVKKGDWEGAEKRWQAEMQNADPKVRGRAAHNLALACEHRGDLAKAIEWATTAGTEYGSKLALSYVRILEYRREQRTKAEAQLQAATAAE